MNTAGSGRPVQHLRRVMARVNEDPSTDNADAVFASASLLSEKVRCEQKGDAQDESAGSA
jgi:hypothetical protein